MPCSYSHPPPNGQRFLCGVTKNAGVRLQLVETLQEQSSSKGAQLFVISTKLAIIILQVQKRREILHLLGIA